MNKLSDKKRQLLQMKDNIVLGYNNGLSLRELAIIYDVSHGSIRSFLIEEGVELRQTGRRIKEYDQTKQVIDKEKAHEHYKRRKKKDNIILNWLITKYEGVSCVDCNKTFPFCVMDFDHKPDEIKEFNISTKGQYKITPENIALVEKEISKCQLICSNCHRIRTWITRKK